MGKPTTIHSRARHTKHLAAKRKGRHTGTGKRMGAKCARMPEQLIWMRRQRVLRRMLGKYRDAKKIDKQLYHALYMMCKGDKYKNKRVLMETIHRMMPRSRVRRCSLSRPRPASPRPSSR